MHMKSMLMISDIHCSVLPKSSKNKNTFYSDPYNFIVIAVKNNNCSPPSAALPKTLSLKNGSVTCLSSKEKCFYFLL